MPPRPPAPAVRPSSAPRPGGARRPTTPQERARAQARAKAAAARARADAKAARRAEARARRRAALTRWTHRTGAVGGALTVVLVAAVVMSGVQPETPAAASAPLDLAGQATALRDQLDGTLTDLQSAQAAVTAAQTALDSATAELAVDQAELETARTAVGTGAAQLYRGTPAQRALGAGYVAGSDVTAAGPVAVLADRATQERAALVVAAQTAGRQVALAARRVDTARAALTTAQDDVAEVTAAARARAAATDLTVTTALAGLPGAPSSAEHQATDAAARVGWQTRLGALAAAGITLPTAQQLVDGDLPDGLTPLLDASGAVVPGVAAGVVDGAVVTVPSAEAAAAVSFAFAQLGTPYVPGGTTSAGLGCAGLASTVWTAAGTPLGTTLAAQWAGGTIVPAGQLQAGDLVFGSSADAGLDDVGVYVGDGLVITASAVGYQVAVTTAPADGTAVRPTLPTATPNALPTGTGTQADRCGAEPAPVVTTPVDPAWGGWSNGRIPTSALCAIDDGQWLRCDAAAAYTALAQAYQLAFGAPLCITDSYRSFDAQTDAHRRKPGITAVPGTSNHGWGLAVDLCGGINVSGTPQATWMERYAGQFGWVHPDWAQATGENPEPWHWEFSHLAD